MRHSLAVFVSVLLCGIPSGAASAQSAPDPLEPLTALLGRWSGTSEGEPGTGRVEREYVRVLDSRFIRLQNRVVYPPQEKNPRGEVHEDMGMFSFDTARRRLVLRQFHGEGFVNVYVADDPLQPRRLSFTTEAIENIGPGWRARETYVIHGPDGFEEVFELAKPGQEFQVYSRSRLTRVR